MVGARDSAGRQELAGHCAKPALHPVADHSAADFLGDREADALGWVPVAAVADQQDEAGARRSPAGVGGEEVRALADRG
jgi:hypothetical protein